MTLQQVIDYLQTQDPDYVAPLGLGKPDSYRGSYNELAFAPQEAISVRQMLTNARMAMGTVYYGYKGGYYEMGPSTPVHLADWGECGEEIGPVFLKYICGEL